jgi:uncharacterized protein
MELLDAVEIRVLGALIEKEATTPEYYPLSMNALLSACNQKSNRDPVVEYDEGTVADAIESLRAKRCVFIITGSRVDKFSQRLSETLNLGRRELAVLCTLMLRGPQTLGEVKDRSERLFSFADLEETERVLEKLSEWPDGALVKKLPKQSGQKEARYGQLLSGEPSFEAFADSGQPSKSSRIADLEQEIQRMQAELADLKRRFDAFEEQFR